LPVASLRLAALHDSANVRGKTYDLQTRPCEERRRCRAVAAGRVSRPWVQQRARPPGNPLGPVTWTRSSAPAATAHTYPGRRCPVDLVQLSPDSGKQAGTGAPAITTPTTEIAGFSHTHLSGTGLAISATSSSRRRRRARKCRVGRVGRSRTRRRRASRGYYSVDCRRTTSVAELTPPPCRPPPVLVPQAGCRPPACRVRRSRIRHHGDEPVETQLTARGPDDDLGLPFRKAGRRNQRVFFAARFLDAVPDLADGDDESSSGERRQSRRSARRGLFRFVLRPGPPLLLKVGTRRGASTGAPPGTSSAKRRLGVRRLPEERRHGLGAEAPAASGSRRRQGAQVGLLHRALPIRCWRRRRSDDADASYRRLERRRSSRRRRSKITPCSRCGTTFRALPR